MVEPLRQREFGPGASGGSLGPKKPNVRLEGKGGEANASDQVSVALNFSIPKRTLGFGRRMREHLKA